MPAHKSTQLKGHGLQAEGKACEPDPTYGYQLTGEQTGCGLCSCGEQSPELPTDAARKRWHKAHKDQLRSNGSGDD